MSRKRPLPDSSSMPFMPSSSLARTKKQPRQSLNAKFDRSLSRFAGTPRNDEDESSSSFRHMSRVARERRETEAEIRRLATHIIQNGKGGSALRSSLMDIYRPPEPARRPNDEFLMKILYKGKGPSYGTGAGDTMPPHSLYVPHMIQPPFSHPSAHWASQAWPQQPEAPYTPLSSRIDPSTNTSFDYESPYTHGIAIQDHQHSDPHRQGHPPSTLRYEQIGPPQQEQKGRWVWHPSPTTSGLPLVHPSQNDPPEYGIAGHWTGPAIDATLIPAAQRLQPEIGYGRTYDTPPTGQVPRSASSRMDRSLQSNHRSELDRELTPSQAINGARVTNIGHASRTGGPYPPPLPPGQPIKPVELNSLDARAQQGHSSLKENVRPPSKGILRRDIRCGPREAGYAASVHFREGPDDTSTVRRFPSEMTAAKKSISSRETTTTGEGKQAQNPDRRDSNSTPNPTKSTSHASVSIGPAVAPPSAARPLPDEQPRSGQDRAPTPFHPAPSPISPPSSGSRRRLGQKEKTFVARALEVAQQLVLESMPSDTDTEESDELNLRPTNKRKTTAEATHPKRHVERQQRAPSPSTASDDSSESEDDHEASVPQLARQSQATQALRVQSDKCSGTRRRNVDTKPTLHTKSSASRQASRLGPCHSSSAPKSTNAPVELSTLTTAKSSSKVAASFGRSGTQSRIPARPRLPSPVETGSNSSFGEDVASIDSETETDECHSDLRPMSSYKIPSLPHSQVHPLAHSKRDPKTPQAQKKNVAARHIKIIPNRAKAGPKQQSRVEEVKFDDPPESIDEFSDRASPDMPTGSPASLQHIPQVVEQTREQVAPAPPEQTSSDGFWCDGGELGFTMWRDHH